MGWRISLSKARKTRGEVWFLWAGGGVKGRGEREGREGGARGSGEWEARGRGEREGQEGGVRGRGKREGQEGEG